MSNINFNPVQSSIAVHQPENLPVTTKPEQQNFEVTVQLPLSDAQVRLRSMSKNIQIYDNGIQLLSETDFKESIHRPIFSTAKKTAYDAALVCLRNTNTAMQEISALKPTDLAPAKANTPEGINAFQMLTRAVQAQNALNTAIIAMQDAGFESTSLLSLQQQTQFRSGELIELAARMQKPENADFQELSSAASIGVALNSISVEMHGSSAIFSSVKQQAQTLMTRLDTFESQKEQLSPENFQLRLSELQSDIHSLKAAITKNTASLAQRNKFGVSLQNTGDGVQTLLKALNQAEVRIQQLPKADTLKPVLQMVNFLIPSFPGNMIKNCGFMPNLSQIAQQIANLSTAAHNAVAKEIKNGTLTEESWARHMAPLHQVMQQPMAQLLTEILENLPKAINAIKTGDNNNLYNGITLYSEKRGSVITAICNNLLEIAGDPKKLEEVQKFVSLLSNSCVVQSEARYNAERDELLRMQHGIHQTPQLRSAFLSQAFEHPINITTIIEAHMRGMSPDHLELRAVDENLVSANVLGSGVYNTVQLCKYSVNGESIPFVFKPEIPAARADSGGIIQKLGYSSCTRIVQRNVATSLCAESIGTGAVVAQSKAGILRGQFGLFMEQAKGASIKNLNEHGVMKVPDGRELTFPQILTELEANNLKDTAMQNLCRELNNLEWTDVLTGQIDRHGDNYLVHINPQDGSVSVCGIDNDASFSGGLSNES